MDKKNEYQAWYKEGIVYQIYPRSFKDSNDDGIGDLKGITSKVDYIAGLGVTMVWLSPIYASPLDDNGYDISDYYNIHPDYGTLDDFKEMLDAFHKKGIKVVMDLVVNHTSDEHEWFKEAKKGEDNPYHDYYFFRKAKGRKLPNNWTSFFGGPAWEYVPECDSYYLHLFSKKQPDLNWDNPKVRAEIKKILRFWLNMGVDGFRCDVINLISKRQGLPNGKKRLFLCGLEHYANGPRIHDYLYEMKKDVFSRYDCFTVGECGMLTPEGALTYIARGKEELNMVFQFDHMGADTILVKWFIRKFKLSRLKKALTKWQYEINGKGWNTLYLENHDQPRSINRFGNLDFRIKSATLLAMFVFLEQGTPFIYEGEEIGMTNPGFESLDDYKDVETHNIYKEGRTKFHFSHKVMMRKIKYMSRDNARTPMQWDDTENAGFSDAKPWIRVNPNYPYINAQKDLNSKDSIYKFYQKLFELRKNSNALIYGDYFEYYPKSNNIICYKRYDEKDTYFIVCNYSKRRRNLRLPFDLKKASIVLDNYGYTENTKLFEPYQGKVYKMN